jgi:hypothetical protein
MDTSLYPVKCFEKAHGRLPDSYETSPVVLMQDFLDVLPTVHCGILEKNTARLEKFMEEAGISPTSPVFSNAWQRSDMNTTVSKLEDSLSPGHKEADAHEKDAKLADAYERRLKTNFRSTQNPRSATAQKEYAAHLRYSNRQLFIVRSGQLRQ